MNTWLSKLFSASDHQELDLLETNASMMVGCTTDESNMHDLPVDFTPNSIMSDEVNSIHSPGFALNSDVTTRVDQNSWSEPDPNQFLHNLFAPTLSSPEDPAILNSLYTSPSSFNDRMITSEFNYYNNSNQATFNGVLSELTPEQSLCSSMFQAFPGFTMDQLQFEFAKLIANQVSMTNQPSAPIQSQSSADSDSSSYSEKIECNIVEGNKIYTCPIEGCNKTYCRPYNVKLHIKAAHQKSKPYHCTHSSCDAKFARKYDLIRHERTHGGLKEFICRECQSTFTRKEHLRNHVENQKAGKKCAGTRKKMNRPYTDTY